MCNFSDFISLTWADVFMSKHHKGKHLTSCTLHRRISVHRPVQHPIFALLCVVWRRRWYEEQWKFSKFVQEHYLNLCSPASMSSSVRTHTKHTFPQKENMQGHTTIEKGEGRPIWGVICDTVEEREAGSLFSCTISVLHGGNRDVSL